MNPELTITEFTIKRGQTWERMSTDGVTVLNRVVVDKIVRNVVRFKVPTENEITGAHIGLFLPGSRETACYRLKEDA